MAGDMKQGLTGSRPKMSILPRAALVYGVRPLEYGDDKYSRGNYHGAPPAGVSAEDRLLGYVDAAMRHLTRVSDAINRVKGTGGDIKAACATVDDDGGGKFPASNLPDMAHALASIMIGITCAVDDGLLPADPGQPWKQELVPQLGLPQKDDPAAEKARVAMLIVQPSGRTSSSGMTWASQEGAGTLADKWKALPGVIVPIAAPKYAIGEHVSFRHSSGVFFKATVNRIVYPGPRNTSGEMQYEVGFLADGKATSVLTGEGTLT